MLGRVPSRCFKDLFSHSLREANKRYALTRSSDSDLRTFYYELGINGIVNRLQSVQGRRFRNVAFIGPLAEEFWKEAGTQLGVEAITVIDEVKESVDRSVSRLRTDCPANIRVVGLALSEKDSWSFPESYFDLIMNNLQLHWVNNVHGMFSLWHRSLTPDGALIGACLGGDTLQELRIALSLGEQEREGGISTHVSPTLSVTDVGNALNRTNYKLVTTTTDANLFYFDDMFALTSFLQAVGEGNTCVDRRERVSKHTFIAAAAVYRHLFTSRDGEFKGKVPATFDVVHYIGWKQHESQSKPLKAGTRGVNLKDIAEEVQDEDMEFGELLEKDGSVKVNYLRGKNPRPKS